MLRDSMKQISNSHWNTITMLATQLGIPEKDLTSLKQQPDNNPLIKAGPRGYGCSYYGTISINDFQKKT